ncbi:exonuclease domain-containing protein [Streptomyces sp. NP160]|uniref:exonuclease domain-containing protein n=1 Tax=Streptomyces sp. NP160 TaxID=2586637 RepID=UPI0015D64E17|nr:exonuclease domain-containing protein [Streptomyces sp. NP160]
MHPPRPRTHDDELLSQAFTKALKAVSTALPAGDLDATSGAKSVVGSEAGPVGLSGAGQGLDFVALDVETANYRRGSICAIGLVIVRGGQITERHAWLVRPAPALDWFDSYNTSLHGIGPADVVAAPSFAASLQRLVTVVGELPVVAHNAAFDIGALRDACDAADLAWPSLTYACSLVMARRALPLISYRLPMVAGALGVDLLSHHDAAADAEAAARIVLAIGAQRRVTSLDALATQLLVLLGQVEPDAWRGCHRTYTSGSGGKPLPPQANPEADPHHYLFGQVMVFTGALSLRREDAWAQVAALGAIPESDVTKRTNLLVIGGGFTGSDPADFATGKAARAAAKRAKGQDIEVLSETDLLSLLNETTTGGRRLRRPAPR